MSRLKNKSASPNGAQTASDNQPQPPESIELAHLFPGAQQDLDALFPEPDMKRLLKDVVENLKKNQRFIKRLNRNVTEEEETG